MLSVALVVHGMDLGTFFPIIFNNISRALALYGNFFPSHKISSKPRANITCSHCLINHSFTQFSRTIKLCTKVSMQGPILITIKVVPLPTYLKFLMLTSHRQYLNTWLAYSHSQVAMLEDACTCWWVYLIDSVLMWMMELLLSNEDNVFALDFAPLKAWYDQIMYAILCHCSNC